MWLNKKTDFVDSMWQINETDIKKIDKSVVRELSSLFNFKWIKSKTLQNIFLVTIWYSTIDINNKILSLSVNWPSDIIIQEYGIDNIIKSAYIEQFYLAILANICTLFEKSQADKIKELINDSIEFFWEIWIKEYEQKMLVIKEIFWHIRHNHKEMLIDCIDIKSNEASIDEIIELIYFFRSLQDSLNKYRQMFLIQLFEVIIKKLISWKAVIELIENVAKSNWTQQKILIQKWKEFEKTVGNDEKIEIFLPWLHLQMKHILQNVDGK